MAKLILASIVMMGWIFTPGSATVAPLEGSCLAEGACGNENNPGCSCGSTCMTAGDCCDDVVETCGYTCKDKCGQAGGNGCFCDDLCSFFKDCCPDKFEWCKASPSPPLPPSPPPALSPPPFPPGTNTGPCFIENACGLQATKAGCSCAPTCLATQNCCSDVVETCGYSCIDSCETLTGNGCFCDVLCIQYNDCCPQYIEECQPEIMASPPSPPYPPGTINCALMNACGQELESMGCSCEGSCYKTDNCCDDIVPSCGFSCKDKCGALFLPHGGCFCDEMCTFYVDCCPDYEDECMEDGVLKGDVNGDVDVNIQDVIQLVLFVVGQKTLSDSSLINGDFDEDNVVDIVDIITLTQYLLD